MANLYKDYKKYDEAKEEFETLIGNGHEDALVYKSLGEVQYQLRNYKKAIANFEKASKHFPNDRHLEYYLGVSYTQTGEFAQALAHLKGAAAQVREEKVWIRLQEGPKEEISAQELYRAMGYCHFQLNQFEASAKSYLKAAAINPPSEAGRQLRNDAARAYIQLANGFLKEGNKEEAIAHLRSALKCKPADDIIGPVTTTLEELGVKVDDAYTH